jgi:hypothetical protein
MGSKVKSFYRAVAHICDAAHGHSAGTQLLGSAPVLGAPR